jgi:hypothetical protein
MAKNEQESTQEVKTLESWLMSAIKKGEPQSLNKLVKMVRAAGYSEEDTISEISRLEKLGRLRLRSSFQNVREFKRLFFSFSMLWYWGVIAISLTAIISVLAISPSLFPFVYIRWISGLAILLWVPGFCFVKALFPKKEIGNLETLILSVSSSLILVIFVGLFCNFTPLGLGELPIVAALSALSITLASIAVWQAK